jgi:hypothetical protein
VTRRHLITAAIWATGLAAVATCVFEDVSFGLAHGNPVLVAVYLPYWPAARGVIPPMSSLPVVFVYEVLYFLTIGLVVLALKSLPKRSAHHG